MKIRKNSPNIIWNIKSKNWISLKKIPNSKKKIIKNGFY